jgi:ClpP class serine protease
LKELQFGYQQFVKIVADNRHLSVASTTALANGSAIAAQEALQDGLIDRIGNIDDVRNYLTDRIGVRASMCTIDE